MSLSINTTETTQKRVGNHTVQTKSRKDDVVLAAEIANQSVQNVVQATGRTATLVKELTEAEAAMELLEHKFKLSHFALADELGKWLVEARQTRVALDAEFRGIAKAIADITAYFGTADVKRTAAELKELCEVVERIRALNADPATQKLIEAVLAR